MMIGIVFIPNIKAKINGLFQTEDGLKTEDQTIEYVLMVKADSLSSYVAVTFDGETDENGMYYSAGYSENVNILDYQGSVFSYGENDQTYFDGSVVPLFENAEIKTTVSGDVVSAYTKVQNDEADVLFVPVSYGSLLGDMVIIDVLEVRKKAEEISDSSSQIEETKEMLSYDLSINNPLVIFIAGSDTRGYALTTYARTDVDIVLVMNPRMYKILMVSIPRDSYILNPYLGYSKDKLTHMAVYGMNNALNALFNWLDVGVNQYLLVNFRTFQTIIDTVGGITVNNPYAFSSSFTENYYAKGNIILSGYSALYYVRERYNLPDGDFGRNMHEALVLEALINKLTRNTSFSTYYSLLNALQGSFLTNLTTDYINDLMELQTDQMPSWTIEKYAIKGSTGPAYTASIPYATSSCVFPYEEQVEEVKALMKQYMTDGY